MLSRNDTHGPGSRKSLLDTAVNGEDALSIIHPMLRFLSEAVSCPPQEGYTPRALQGLSYILDLLDSMTAEFLEE